MAFDLQFVDTISASPTVRLDLLSQWVVRDTTEFGVPELHRAAVSTLLAEGERYPAAAYGNRVITLVLQARDGDSEDETAAALQTLVRELDRPSGLLRYRPGTSEPVFFRTFRSAVSGVTWDPVLRQVVAAVAAEPFALGLRESLSAVAVSADPAAGSNGMFLDVTAPKGDVETPLFLSVPAADVSEGGRRTSLIAVRRRGTPSLTPFVVQAEAFSIGDDTTVQPNSATMSGAGSNYVRTTFATNAAMATRVQGTWPGSSGWGPDVWGTYRAFVRTKKSVGGDTITVRLVVSLDGALTTGDTVTLPADTSLHWTDLGLVQYPLGPNPQYDGYSGTLYSVRGQTLQVQAARTSGSGNLDLDAVILVPADDRLMLVKWAAYGGWSDSTGPASYIVDSATEQVYPVGNTGELRATQSAEVAGGFPMISPGTTNRVYFVPEVGTANADALTDTVTITPYYWPRYLYTRPVGT